MLQTNRLILRHPVPADGQAFLEIHNTEFVLRFNGMNRISLEKAIKQLSDSCDRTWLLEQKETGKVIGAIFTQEDSIRWGVESLEVSYFLDERCSRQGYMKEALHTLIGYLFETRQLTCVAARAFAPNTASHKLLESLGFHRDGYIPQCVKGYRDVIFDDVLYSVFRENWK